MWNGHNCQDIFTEVEHLLWREKSIHPSSQEVSLAHGLLLVGHAQNTYQEVPGRDPNQISEPPEQTRRMIGSSTLSPSDMNELFVLFLAHSNIWRHRKQPSDPLGNSQSAGSKPTRTPTTFCCINDILTRETMSMTHVSLFKWTLQEQQLLAVQCCLHDAWY